VALACGVALPEEELAPVEAPALGAEAPEVGDTGFVVGDPDP